MARGRRRARGGARSVRARGRRAQLTRSRGPYSSASARVSPSRAPLTVASGTQLMPGRRLSTPATRAMAPPSASRGATCLQQKYAVQNFVSNNPCVSVVGSVPMGPCGAEPAALQTRPSHSPCARDEAKAATAVSSLASRQYICTLFTSRHPVLSTISVLAALSFSLSRDAMRTRPPRVTTALATALPIPDEPPTTTTAAGGVPNAAAAAVVVSSAASGSACTHARMCATDGLDSDNRAPSRPWGGGRQGKA